MSLIDTLSLPLQVPGDEPQWFAIQTRHRHEKRVAERLQNAHLETFLPLHRAIHRWNNGVRACLELPLFPSYLFTRVRRADRLQVLREPGVISIAASSVSPTPIPDEDISRLRLAAANFEAQPHPYVSIGERVKVVAGPLSGLEGVLLRKKQELRVVVSVEIILRSIIVEVSESEVEPVREHRVAIA